jgi:hypothetical protein
MVDELIMEWKTVNLAEIYGAADQANLRKAQLDAYNRELADEQRLRQEADAIKGAYTIGADGELDAKTTLANLYRVNPMKAMEFKQSMATAEQEQQKAKIAKAKDIAGIYKDSATAVLANPSIENAALQLQRFSRMTGEDVSQELQQIQTMTPEQIKQWAAGHALEATNFLTKFETKDAGGQLITQGIDPLSGRVSVTNTTQKTMTPDQIEDNRIAQANLGVNQARLGLDRQKFALDQQKAANPAPTQKTQLSPTAQKELFEADEIAKASENVIGMLKEAKGLNDKAYSGIGAKPLAVVRSNLPGFGASEGADATINLDNLMTGQALESLKATFGGMPTEGERKILLDMQASADKTPAQRKAILDRAISAAERRLKFNKSKADALRKGTYFTEGVTEQQAPAQPQGQSTVIDFGSLK